MNDIVERLREEARYRADELDFDDEHPSAILARLIETEAADEIERLRSERDEAVRLLRVVTMQIRSADLMRSGLDGPIDAFLASLEDKS